MNLNLTVSLNAFVNMFREFEIHEYSFFIKHAFRVAKIVRELSKFLSLPVDSDYVYLMGLLHQIGLPLIAATEHPEFFRQKFGKISDMEELSKTFSGGEKHPIVSKQILSSVRFLPQNLSNAIFYHRDPSKCMDLERTLSYSLMTADIVARKAAMYESLHSKFLEETVYEIKEHKEIPDTVKDAMLKILSRYSFAYLIDDQPRFFSEKELTLEEFGSLAKLLVFLLDFRSTFTRNHSILVAEVSKKIAEEILSEEDGRLVYIAGLLHDIGKIRISPQLLHKASRLNEQEMFVMKTHVLETYKILSESGIAPCVTNIAAAHHERLDGSGYPLGLTAKNLMIHQRILQVADVFVALIEERPYRRALSVPEAFEILESEIERGRLDTRIFEALKQIINEGNLNIPESFLIPDYIRFSSSKFSEGR
ncbi:hypothetical protein AS005_00255 [Thermotoga sp. KOL6]|nr:hypothetical protein AS005_00255 [Thermotoga sp. KOL6]